MNLKRSWYWPQNCNDVVQKLLRKGRKGARIIYVPGNHDEAFRQFVGLNLGGVELAQQAIHVTANGRKLLVLHGDEDLIVPVDWGRELAATLPRSALVVYSGTGHNSPLEQGDRANDDVLAFLARVDAEDAHRQPVSAE